MYPLGESKPPGLWDMAGNVWEWTNSWDNAVKTIRVVRGGSWRSLCGDVRPIVRHWVDPHSYDVSVGFRLVSPIDADF